MINSKGRGGRRERVKELWMNGVRRSMGNRGPTKDAKEIIKK